MRNLGSNIAASIGLSVLLLAAATPAKAETPTMFVHIPFQFVAGDEVLAAGTYAVTPTAGFPFVDLKSTKECISHRVFLSGRVQRDDASPEQGLLRFEKYGDKVVLQAFWSPWRTEGFQIRPSKSTIELTRTGGGVTGIAIDAQSK